MKWARIIGFTKPMIVGLMIIGKIEAIRTYKTATRIARSFMIPPST
jgi:hypothetical protein